MPISHTVTFEGASQADAELDHPPGRGLARALQAGLAEYGFAAGTPDVWRDVGWTLDVRHANAQVEVCFTAMGERSWMLQAAQDGVIREPGHRDSDWSYSVAAAVGRLLTTFGFANQRWRVDGPPRATDPGFPYTRPWRHPLLTGSIPDALRAAAVPLLIESLPARLAAHGFLPGRTRELSDNAMHWDWTRDRGWGIDRVWFWRRRNDKAYFNLGVGFALRLGTGREIDVDGTTAHTNALFHEVSLRDRFIRLRTPAAVAHHFLDELGRALPWLERYATPSRCLAQLASWARNGIGVGTPVHAEAVAFVRTLASSGG